MDNTSFFINASRFRSNSWKDLFIEEPNTLPDEFKQLFGEPLNINPPSITTTTCFEPKFFSTEERPSISKPNNEPNLSFSIGERRPITRINNDSVIIKEEKTKEVLGLLTEESNEISELESSDSDICMNPNMIIPSSVIIKREPLVFRMDNFPPEKVTDFKHMIYNLLVEGYNSGDPNNHVVLPCVHEIDGVKRHGFQFNNNIDPEKKIPELYGFHIHHSRLELENQSSPFIQDLYKFYHRAGVELLGKYFEKIGRYTFLYDPQLPLFVAGGSLREAEQRIKKMRTRARKTSTSVQEEPLHESGPFKKKRSSSRKVPYLAKCGGLAGKI